MDKSSEKGGRARVLLILLSLALTSAADPTSSVSSRHLAFVRENNVAMMKMMAGMDVTPTGDVDADFVAMMVPHHQGAIDMAVAELRHGRNEKLRRIAQEIIISQQQEIAAMRLSLGQPLPPSVAAPTQALVASGGRQR